MFNELKKEIEKCNYLEKSLASNLIQYFGDKKI